MLKKDLLVAIDNFCAWPDPLFVYKLTIERVIEFSNNFIAHYGISKQTRSDPRMIFISERYKLICSLFQIRNLTCTLRDHRGNGRIDLSIRTITQRLPTNKSTILK